MAEVRIPQRVAAYWEEETAYGTPLGANLRHVGLLDTFDPRMFDRQYAAIPSIGHSVDPHQLSGPVNVTLPLKIGLWGDGWKSLLGRAIGITSMTGDSSNLIPAFLTTGTDSVTILAEEELASTWQATMVPGVTFNSAMLEADFSTANPMTVTFDCLARFSVEGTAGTRTVSKNFGTVYDGGSSYHTSTIEAAPSADPLTAQDLTLSYSTATGALDADALQLTDTSGKYVEVGERYMRFFLESGAAETEYTTGDNAAFLATGVLDLNHANTATLNDTKALLNAAHSGTPAVVPGAAEDYDSQNLLKGVYQMTGSTVNIPCIADATTTLTEWPYVKTVKLTVTNALTGIPQKTTINSVNYVLQNADVVRGKSEVTLEVTSTAKDETFYDLMHAETLLPLVRLTINDGGTDRTIALTNGRITARTAGYTAAGETTESVTVKFTGSGDVHNWSKYAISGDF